jgi:hypothetical protein
MAELTQALHDWAAFYLLVGTSAATLAGLLFVALSLAVTLLPTGAANEAGARAFVTPSLVYLVYVLVIAAILNVPQISPEILAAILAVGGIVGVVFVVPRGRTLRAVRSDPNLKPRLDTDDWLWYLALPVLSYCLVVASAVLLLFDIQIALILLAIAVLLLTIAAVRNTWDLMLWIARQR